MTLCTVQSKRKFTIASARHASALDITRARIASRGTVTRLHIARKQSFTSSVARCDTAIPRVCSHYFIILAVTLQSLESARIISSSSQYHSSFGAKIPNIFHFRSTVIRYKEIV